MKRSWSGWRPRPAETLLLVLLLMLLLSGFLAYHAWDAARSHRQVREAALRDYAGFAAWELRRRVEAEATAVLNAALAPQRMAVTRWPGAEPALETEMAALVLGAQQALRTCRCGDAVSDFFLIDPDSRAVHLRDATMGPTFREWLATDVVERVRGSMERIRLDPPFRTEARAGERVIIRQPPSGERVFVSEPPGEAGSTRAVAYTILPRGDDLRVFGFLVEVPEFVRPLIEDAFREPTLLPLSLMGTTDNERAVSARMWSAGGDTIFRAGGAFDAEAGATDTVQLPTGPLTLRLAVRPEMAGQLVIGGLPRSRVPLLLGSMGLTFALLAIALVQLRRQQAFFRLRTDFVSGVSHELRTPLAQIRLFSDLLASGRLQSDQRRRSIRILTEESQRLTYLVENILRFSRSERNMERVSPTSLQPARLLREIVSDFAPLAHSCDARVSVDAPERVHARVDPDALRQILLNLLDNAVKYGPRGQRIEVRARAEGEWLSIEVDDEGPGVPAADRERIWEPYRRLTRDVEASTGGSGIGLAVVRDLVALHGGRAFVTDGSRGGSRFVVQLPGVEVMDTPPVERETTAGVRGARV